MCTPDSSPFESLLPESVRRALGDPPYISVATPDGVLAPTLATAAADGTQYELGDTGLVASVAIRVDAEHRVAVQSVTLSNDGDAPSPPLQDISTVALRLRAASGARPELHWINGGLTHNTYPPLAYQENATSFGVGTSHGPGARHEIGSGPDGRSANGDLPIAQLQWLDDGTQCGVWAALEWSAMWAFGIRAIDRTEWLFQGGPKVNGVVLDPGESLVLPDTHIGVFEGDVEVGRNSARRYIYDCICPGYDGARPLPPASYDHWFGVGERIDESFLMRQVDACAALNLEFFVLDASWFPGAKNAFSEGVGNWERIDHDKFPNGLEPLAEYVRAKGMKFGLWFDVERAHRASDWVREHPSWYWDIGGDYLHLDMTRREAQDGIIEMIDTWIRRLDVRWSRWDYNIGPKPFWDDVDPTGKVQFAYMRGLYRVLDTLMERHPQWLIECCASGGRRIDLGTLRRAHTIWFSDHSNDPHICRLMQTGSARYLPGHLSNSSVEVHMGEGHSRFDDAAILSRMAGAFSIDGDVASWSERRLQEVGKLVDVYLEYRHLLVKDFRALTPYPRATTDWDVAQFTDPATTDTVILAYRVAGDDEIAVHPQGLNSEATYAVRSPLSGSESTVTGRALTRDGIRIALPTDGATVRRLVPTAHN